MLRATLDAPEYPHAFVVVDSDDASGQCTMAGTRRRETKMDGGGELLAHSAIQLLARIGDRYPFRTVKSAFRTTALAIKRNKLAVVYLLALSTAYVCILLAYTHGALLYAGDQQGYYSASDFWIYPAPTSLLFSGLVLISSGNPYFAFYAGMYVSAFFCASAAFYFATQLVPEGQRHSKTVIGAVAGLLVIFNPTRLVTAPTGVWIGVLPEFGFFLLFLAVTVRRLKVAGTSRQLAVTSWVAPGICLGLSFSPLPNNIRGMLAAIFFLVAMATFVSLSEPGEGFQRLRRGRYLAASVLLTVFIATLAGSFSLLPVLSNPASYASVSKAAASQTSLGAIVGPYDTILHVFQLTGLWGYYYGYSPGAAAYSATPLSIITLAAWPGLAFSSLLFRHERSEKRLIVGLAMVSLLIVFWDKATNPPFGQVYAYASSANPFGALVMPPFYLTEYLQTAIYPALIGVSSLRIAEGISQIRVFRGTLSSSRARFRRKSPLTRQGRVRVLRALTIISIASILLVSVYPMLDGSLQGEWFDESVKGFWLPKDYVEVQHLLDQEHGGALVMPELGTYIQTSWNYQGASSFYNYAFAPVPVLDQLGLGRYSQLSKPALATYQELTTPVVPEPNGTEIPALFYPTTVVGSAGKTVAGGVLVPANASSQEVQIIFKADPYWLSPKSAPCNAGVSLCSLVNYTLQALGAYPGNATVSGSTAIVNIPNGTTSEEVAFYLSMPINVSQSSYLSVSLGVSGLPNLTSVIQSGGVMIGLASKISFLKWYTLGSGPNATFEGNATNVNGYLKVPELNQSGDQTAWEAGISTIYLKLNALSLPDSLSFDLPLITSLGARVNIPTPGLNLASNGYVDIHVPCSNSAYLQNLVNNSSVQLGLGYPPGNSVRWYNLGSDPGSYTRQSTGGLDIFVIAGAPNQPWGGSISGASNVTSVYLQLNGALLQPIAFGTPLLSFASGVTIAPGWILLMKLHNLGSLVLDYSVIVGENAPPQYLDMVRSQIVTDGMGHLVYEGPYLTLIQLY